jgi:Uma2 family endonuclease
MSIGIEKSKTRPSVRRNGAAWPQEPFEFSLSRYWRLSVAQYHGMINAGLLTEHDRVELLEGLLIAKMPHNPPHDATIHIIHSETQPRVPPGWSIRIQSAVTLGKSEPEPDLALVRGDARRFLKAHPVARDIGVLIEVADSTIAEDRIVKGRIYARAFVPVYWLVNLQDYRIEVYTEPRTGRRPRYSARQDYGPGDVVPLIIDGREVARISVRKLLPEPA